VSEQEIILTALAPGDPAPPEPDLLAALRRTPAQWAWWSANPDGLCLGSARDGEGRLCAAVVGLRHRARLAGETTHFLEIVDVFNAFDAGQGLRRARGYLELNRAFADEFCGRMPEGIPLAYGVPNRRAHRLGLRHLGYEILRSENKLTLHPDGIASPPTSTQIEEVERCPDEIQAAFERSTAGYEAVIERDAARLDWRFAAHPTHAYRIAVARRDGELTGYVVYRRGTWDGVERGLIADWAVPTDDGESRHALLAWVAARVRADGLEAITFSVPDRSREWSLFQELGFRASGTHDYLVFRSFQKPYVMSWLFENWFYTLADTERG